MTSPTGATPATYGVEAGYSEDYGADAKPKLPTLDNNEYNATGVYGSTNGTTGSATQPGSAAAPVNPFTQQQYQENVTNPFARK